jgi:hypothetical protein
MDMSLLGQLDVRNCRYQLWSDSDAEPTVYGMPVTMPYLGGRTHDPPKYHRHMIISRLRGSNVHPPI